MGAATVDDASGGRLILGLGRGHRSITGHEGTAEHVSAVTAAGYRRLPPATA